jgi:hypothetical protein
MQTNFPNLRGYLDQLRDGRKLHDIVGLVLQVMLLVAGLSLVGVWWRTWSPGSGVGFFGWVALVVWQAAWPLAVFLALQALFLRASEIRRLPSSRYVVAPMVELLLRGFGEATLTAALVLAVPAMLALWFNGTALFFHLIPSMPALAVVLPWLNAARFWSGLLALVALPAQGLMALLGCYFSAELVIALFAIADDVRAIRTHTSEATPEDHG